RRGRGDSARGDAAVRGRAARARLTGGELREGARGERAGEGVAREGAAARHEVFMELAADRFVVGLGGARLAGARGALVDAEGDGVGDERLAVALARTGLGRRPLAGGARGDLAEGRGGARACREQ